MGTLTPKLSAREFALSRENHDNVKENKRFMKERICHFEKGDGVKNSRKTSGETASRGKLGV